MAPKNDSPKKDTPKDSPKKDEPKAPDPKSPEELLQEAVKQLARDPDLTDRMGQAGFESIAAVYDYDRLAEKYAEIVERVAATENSRLRG